MKLRVAVIQLNSPVAKSKLGGLFKKSKNKTRAEKALELAAHIPPNPDKAPQIIVLPEFALTEYNFSSKRDLLAHSEEVGHGPSFRLAQQLSAQHKAYTLVGYPEKAGNKLYNSAVLVSPKGEIVFNYRKTHLCEKDEKLGISESDVGFQSFDLDLGDKVIKASIGITMDLNPYKYEAPLEKWEFGNHCKDNNVDVVLCPMSWLRIESPSETGYWGDYKKELDQIPLNININEGRPMSEFDDWITDYWYKRFVPMYDNKDKRMYLIMANRSGLEGDFLYCGTSCIFELDSHDKSVRFKGLMGSKDEGILYRELDV